MSEDSAKSEMDDHADREHRIYVTQGCKINMKRKEKGNGRNAKSKADQKGLAWPNGEDERAPSVRETGTR